MELLNFLVELLVIGLIFACVGYAAFWICASAKFPQFAYWIVGLVLLIVLIYIVVGLFGHGLHAQWQIFH